MRIVSAVVLLLVLGGMAAPAFAQPDITPELFFERMLMVHASQPYRKITFEFAGQGEARVSVISISCSIAGNGMFTLDVSGKLVMKAEDVKLSCPMLVGSLEKVIADYFRDSFVITDVEKRVREGNFDLMVLSGRELEVAQKLGLIEPAESGSAVLLGAGHDLVAYVMQKVPGRSKRDAILALQKRESYLRYFNQRKAEGTYTPGMLAMRVDIDWETGRILSAATRYPWGEPKLAVTHTRFQNRWVWETVRLDGTIEEYFASIRLAVTLSSFKLEP
jgi:hypothetical protein